MKYDKCDNCLNARKVLSENSYHSLCCLSEKDAMDCFTGKEDYKVKIPNKVESEVSNGRVL